MKIRRIWTGSGNSFLLGDPQLLLRAVGAAEHARTKNGAGDMELFCDR